MRNQEIQFNCYECSSEILFLQDKCVACGAELEWKRINQSYQDKYLEIYEVFV